MINDRKMDYEFYSLAGVDVPGTGYYSRRNFRFRLLN